MSDLHDKFFPYEDMNVSVLKALARLPLSVNECEELLEFDSHSLMVEHELDHIQADTVRMWCQHEYQRHSAASVTGASAKGAADLRDMSKWQPTRTYPIKEGRMKRTKVTTTRQLRQIIAEAAGKKKRSVLKETVADMDDFEATIVESGVIIADKFATGMEQLFQEDPEMFQGRSTPEEWQQQVDAAVEEMQYELEEAIGKVVERIEMQLHDGQYHKGPHKPF